jgi:hypothetical protein
MVMYRPVAEVMLEQFAKLVRLAARYDVAVQAWLSETQPAWNHYDEVAIKKWSRVCDKVELRLETLLEQMTAMLQAMKGMKVMPDLLAGCTDVEREALSCYQKIVEQQGQLPVALVRFDLWQFENVSADQ